MPLTSLGLEKWQLASLHLSHRRRSTGGYAFLSSESEGVTNGRNEVSHTRLITQQCKAMMRAVQGCDPTVNLLGLMNNREARHLNLSLSGTD